MKYLVVIPSIIQSWTDDCLATLKIPKENILVIDNTVENKGVPKSWNMGIMEMRARNVDWIIFMSASMRFGELGGLDFIEQLDVHLVPPFTCVLAELIDEEGIPRNHDWHLIAIKRKVVESVGMFDENFFPAYYEDRDYMHRILQCYDPVYATVKVDVTCAGNNHGVRLAGVKNDPTSQENYYLGKWGGLSGSEKYKNPFNSPIYSVQYWPKYD